MVGLRLVVMPAVVIGLLALAPPTLTNASTHTRLNSAISRMRSWAEAPAGAGELRSASATDHRRMTWAGRNSARTLQTAVAAPGSGAGAPPLSIPDGSGGQYVMWSDERDGTADLFLLRVTNAGTPATGWPADGVVVCDAPGQQFEGQLFSDGANGVIAGWIDMRDDLIFGDVYAQRFNPSGAPQWAANGVLVLDVTAEIDEVTASPDGQNGLVVAWSAAPFSLGDVYATRIDGAGAVAPGWNAGGIVVCDAVEDQSNVAVVGDGAGGAFIAWLDERDPLLIPHVYAQHIDASGTALWTADGNLVDGSVLGLYEPALMRLSGGDVCVAWVDYDGAAYAQRLSSAAGTGQWTPGGSTLHAGGGGAGSPQGGLRMIGEGTGGAIVAWESFSGSIYGIQAQRVNSAGVVQWGASGVSIVSLANSSPGELDLINDGSDGAYFSWEDFRSGGGDIYAQRVTSGGSASWTANGVAVCTAAGGQEDPVAALDGTGDVLICWRDFRSLDAEIFTQRLNSSSVPELAANGFATFTAPGVQFFPGIVQTPDGGVLVAWKEKRNGEYDVRARKLNDDGSPAGPATLLSSAPGGQEPVGMVRDGTGGAIVAWWDDVQQNVYAQRIDFDAVPQWSANGVLVSPAAAVLGGMRMIAEPTGGAIFAWLDGSIPSDPNIRAQKLDGTGAPAWGANGVLVCNDPNFQGQPVIANDGSTGAIIAWNDQRDSSGEIYAQRVDGSGTPQWAANGLLIAGYAGPSPFVDVSGIVAAQAGQVVVLIIETNIDFPTFDINQILHAQKVNGAGSPQWGSGGSTVCDASSICFLEQVSADSAGGAYVGWSDSRNGHFDIFVQRLDAAGSVWNPDGNLVCNAASWQTMGGITTLSGGDVVLSWTDERSGQPDVYAQRVSTSGVAQWTANGRAVSDQARGQYGAALALSKGVTPERLHVAWTDNRAGNARYAYVDQLGLNGVSQWTPDGTTSTQMALASAVADRERVRLTWYGTQSVTATVYRRPESGDWTRLASVSSDGTGKIVFEDRAIEPGARYGYRLGVREGSAEVFLGETWIEVPNDLVLALHGLSPNPAVGDMVVAFTLPSSGAAKLELLDLAGRRVDSRDFNGLGAGRHTVRLAGERPSPGVYFLKLTQDGRSVTTRAAVVQ